MDARSQTRRPTSPSVVGRRSTTRELAVFTSFRDTSRRSLDASNPLAPTIERPREPKRFPGSFTFWSPMRDRPFAPDLASVARRLLRGRRLGLARGELHRRSTDLHPGRPGVGLAADVHHRDADGVLDVELHVGIGVRRRRSGSPGAPERDGEQERQREDSTDCSLFQWTCDWNAFPLRAASAQPAGRRRQNSIVAVVG